MKIRKIGNRGLAALIAVGVGASLPATTWGATAAMAECEFANPVTLSDARVYEGSYWGATTNLSFTLTAGNLGVRNPGGTVMVSAVSGTALAGNDFQFTSRRIDVYSSPITISVPVTRDATDEPNESMYLKLSDPTGCLSLKDGQGVGEILDDDGPLTWNVDNRRAPEGSTTNAMKFRVSLSNPQSSPVTVHYRTTGAWTTQPARPGVDYYAVNDGMVTIPAYSSGADAYVWVIGDTQCEGFGAERHFLVELFSPSTGTVADGVAVGTIFDDDVYLPCQ